MGVTKPEAPARGPGRPRGSGICGGRGGPILRARCSPELLGELVGVLRGRSMGCWLRQAAEEKLARELGRALVAERPAIQA